MPLKKRALAGSSWFLCLEISGYDQPVAEDRNKSNRPQWICFRLGSEPKYFARKQRMLPSWLKPVFAGIYRGSIRHQGVP